MKLIAACIVSFLITLVTGRFLLPELRRLKAGQSIREDGPTWHAGKSGTPTMGGTLILLSIGLTTLLWADLSNRFVWLLLAVTCGTGLIGFVDDYRKVVYKNPKGLSARAKMFWQSAIAIAAGLFLSGTAHLPAT
jgi:phospho-N-acetylmuramoyl-pentapeptide-transferase